MRIQNNFYTVKNNSQVNFNGINARKMLSTASPKMIRDTFSSINSKKSLMSSIKYYHKGKEDELAQILKLAKNRTELLFVKNMEKEVLKQNDNLVQIITDILSSKNKKSYIKNIDNYMSYIKLNSDNKSVIKDLDVLIETGVYDHKFYDKKLDIKELQQELELFDDQAFIKSIDDNYSESGVEFLKHLQNNFLAYRKGSLDMNKDKILEMYDTTTKDNISLRKDFIKKFRFAKSNSNQDDYRKEINTLTKILNLADEDKFARKVIQKIINKDVSIKNLSYLEKVFDTVPTFKTYVFFDNLKNILEKEKEEELISTLKNHLEEPFYIPESVRENYYNAIKYGFKKDIGFIKKLQMKIENKINQLRYYKLNKTTETIKHAPETLKVNKVSVSVDLLNPKTGEAAKLKFTNTPKETSAERKIRLSKEVNEYIKQKLGQKTLERQQGIYSENVTKMRLMLLPDIFDSIKSVRAEAKLKGKKAYVENKDAVKLYNLITGKNRKLVRYMLKQTDAEKHRIFNLKEIINYITSIEKEIASNKKNNSNYKAKDAKELYNSYFDKMVEEYGKLKPKRTSNKN